MFIYLITLSQMDLEYIKVALRNIFVLFEGSKEVLCKQQSILNKYI